LQRQEASAQELREVQAKNDAKELVEKQNIFSISETPIRKGKIQEYIKQVNINIPDNEPKWRQANFYELSSYIRSQIKFINTYGRVIWNKESKIQNLSVWCYV
jgi:hypothetical protein